MERSPKWKSDVLLRNILLWFGGRLPGHSVPFQGFDAYEREEHTCKRIGPWALLVIGSSTLVKWVVIADTARGREHRVYLYADGTWAVDPRLLFTQRWTIDSVASRHYDVPMISVDEADKILAKADDSILRDLRATGRPLNLVDIANAVDAKRGEIWDQMTYEEYKWDLRSPALLARAVR